ncbi:hypothetical protein BDV18DRAFT_136388 [Aspergillus unguis]
MVLGAIPILIGRLSASTTSADLEKEFTMHGLYPLDVALVEGQQSGANRGFAFAIFENVKEAQSAVDLLDGTFIGGRHIEMHLVIRGNLVPPKVLMSRSTYASPDSRYWDDEWYYYTLKQYMTIQ